MARWWLSFCDPRRPEGSQFLGVSIVEAVDEISAAKVAWALGINPGGEIAFMEVEPENVARLSFDLAEYYDRFMPPDEVKALDARISAELDD